MKIWEIAYYTTELNYKYGFPLFRETIRCSRYVAVTIAQRRIRNNPLLHYFDLVGKEDDKQKF